MPGTVNARQRSESGDEAANVRAAKSSKIQPRCSAMCPGGQLRNHAAVAPRRSSSLHSHSLGSIASILAIAPAQTHPDVIAYGASSGHTQLVDIRLECSPQKCARPPLFVSSRSHALVTRNAMTISAEKQSHAETSSKGWGNAHFLAKTAHSKLVRTATGVSE